VRRAWPWESLCTPGELVHALVFAVHRGRAGRAGIIPIGLSAMIDHRSITAHIPVFVRHCPRGQIRMARLEPEEGSIPGGHEGSSHNEHSRGTA
jgi:hypothetical protein